MAAPTISAESATATGTSSPITVNRPGSPSVGDLVVVEITTYAQLLTTNITPPTGFTLAVGTTPPGGNTPLVAYYWKAATASEPASYSFTYATDNPQRWLAHAYFIAGADTSSPVDVSGVNDGGYGTNLTISGITTTVDDCLLLSGFGHGWNNAVTVPSGMTEDWNASQTGPNTRGAGASLALGTGGATGDKTWTLTGEGERAAAMVAIAPSAGGDTTAPVLSSATASATGATTGSGSVTTNEGNGTLYWYISTSATPPSVPDLQAGTGAADSGSQAVSTTGAQSITGGFSGLSPNTTYYAHYQQRDTATNDSAVATSAAFTTSAAPSGPPPQLVGPGNLVGSGPLVGHGPLIG